MSFVTLRFSVGLRADGPSLLRFPALQQPLYLPLEHVQIGTPGHKQHAVALVPQSHLVQETLVCFGLNQKKLGVAGLGFRRSLLQPAGIAAADRLRFRGRAVGVLQ